MKTKHVVIYARTSAGTITLEPGDRKEETKENAEDVFYMDLAKKIKEALSYKTKKMNDPEFAKGYEEIQPEMNVIRAITGARTILSGY